ncbi:unnamed protein product, partial [Ectocarpus sp. 12 AP-2014]
MKIVLLAYFVGCMVEMLDDLALVFEMSSIGLCWSRVGLFAFEKCARVVASIDLVRGYRMKRISFRGGGRLPGVYPVRSSHAVALSAVRRPMLQDREYARLSTFTQESIMVSWDYNIIARNPAVVFLLLSPLFTRNPLSASKANLSPPPQAETGSHPPHAAPSFQSCNP